MATAAAKMMRLMSPSSSRFAILSGIAVVDDRGGRDQHSANRAGSSSQTRSTSGTSRSPRSRNLAPFCAAARDSRNISRGQRATTQLEPCQTPRCWVVRLTALQPRIGCRRASSCWPRGLANGADQPFVQSPERTLTVVSFSPCTAGRPRIDRRVRHMGSSKRVLVMWVSVSVRFRPSNA